MADSQPLFYPTPAQIAAYGSAVRSGGVAPRAVGTTIEQAGAWMTAPRGAPSARPSWRNRLAHWIAGADSGQALFPPMQPLQPIAQPVDFAAVGRPWDYPVGWNTRVTPRMGEKIGFPLLKSLSQFDLVRIMISHVKEQVVAQEWSIGPLDRKQKADARCEQLTELFEYPDRVHTWNDWIKQLLDQVLVYDAPAVWLRPTKGGDPYSLEIMDGSRFTPKIMADGRLPPPEFGPAYQQVLHGLPAVDYILPVPKGQSVPLDPTGQPYPQILYKPRFPRVDVPYGYGPIEQLITTILIGQRREEFFLNFYKDGATPDLILSTPELWSTDQIRDFYNLWVSMLQGNLEARRGPMMVPAGVKVIDTKEGALTDTTDEWIIRLICFCFGLSPMPFTKMMNRASGQQHAQAQKDEGIIPYLGWVAELFNHYIRMAYGWRDVVFRWEEEHESDPLEEAQRFALYLTNKVLHADEVRADLGLDPMSPEMRAQMDQPTFSQAPNATVLPPDQQKAADKRAAANAPEPGPGAEDDEPDAPNSAAPGVAGKGMGKGRLAKLANRSSVRARSY
jgi:hypothetical protein